MKKNVEWGNFSLEKILGRCDSTIEYFNAQCMELAFHFPSFYRGQKEPRDGGKGGCEG
jgi:hypothetical protein